MTRIAVDAMGSDNYPTPDVEGALMARLLATFARGGERGTIGNHPRLDFVQVSRVWRLLPGRTR